MNNSMFLTIACLFFSLTLLIAFFSKKRIKKEKNKVYSWLVIVNVLALVSLLLTVVFRNAIIVKIYLSCLFLWIVLFTLYMVMISFIHTDSGNKKLEWIFLFTYLLSVIVIMLLPIVEESDTILAGPSIEAVTLLSTICIIIIAISMFFNRNNIKNKEYIPIYVFVLVGVITLIIQRRYPELLLVTPLESLITFIMYFTIENPDVEMIEQLNIAREQAEKANHAKSEFLSSMSHEIRTPLNAIVGFSQALLEEEIPEASKEEVEDIVSASLSLLDIVNGILDISKIEANKLEIINKEYSFKKIFDELVILTKARIGEKPIELQTYLDSSLPSVLYGDYVRVKQIILNLLTNAAKYTKQGTITFTVNTVIKNDVCRLIIAVEDTGIGIKQENINKLFTKFERLDQEGNTTIEGTGLGLAITKKLVELMHGNIVVQSVYGKGSKFTVALDQRIIFKEVIEEPTVEVDENLDLSNKSILIVDDNKINLKVAQRLLKTYNVCIDTCESGQECIDKVKNGNVYDLILTDDMMPKMTGVETLHNLKQIPGFKTPTIVLTANAISGMKEKYLQDGFDDYLAKPIDKIELNRILEQFLVQTTEEHDIIGIGCENMKDANYLIQNGVDVNKSLELFGDMETYNETMTDFFGAVAEKLEKIKNFKETSDMANYAIEVHSLKSDSKYLGFTKLAELSYQHEMESKAKNIDYVYDHYDELMEEANRIVNIVTTYLGKTTAPIIEEKAPISDKKILVVDDSNMIRSLIQRIFNGELEVVPAKDGIEATQIIASTPLDKIFGLLLDLNMPNVDGFAVLDWFKKYNLFAKIPVAIITGEDSKENIDRANTYPIVGVVSKPFNERDIKNIVNDMLNFK